MEYFTHENSIVRRIWGRGDTILFIFAGASAEFALNKAVDWLYYTGRLPSDPLGRLFSTVAYARKIVFAEKQAAHNAIDAMAAIHSGVEQARGYSIPDWAYRDVLFMLIDYSIRSFEVLERKLTATEKEDVFTVFYRVGARMGLKGLPGNYAEWEVMRESHIKENLQCSPYTADLFKQYRKHLGFLRYKLLVEVQTLLVPQHVKELLGFKPVIIIKPVISFYMLSRKLQLDRLLKAVLLPPLYRKEILALDN
ncbi:oxygenase MpaB family protein [Flavobacterium sp.]|uniref:oxygenase MpaB family protein n=1 Tax=Flavobacterium sp. TaxID=239 RepID=UPI00261A76FE|nr:oxygenase MpaB family protein [Flavobacterium sp.]